MKNTKKLKCYLASGWFTPKQISTYTLLCDALVAYSTDIDVFYPKNQIQIMSGAINDEQLRTNVFTRNINELHKADFIICSTEDKDMGSVFEAGYAHAIKKPIIYACFSVLPNGFNLMLSESAVCVATSIQELHNALNSRVHTGYFNYAAYMGVVE